jgi:polyribonucleotide nucleotidyltransferase
MIKALEYSHVIIKEICTAQIEFIAEYKKDFGIPEVEATFNTPDESLY